MNKLNELDQRDYDNLLNELIVSNISKMNTESDDAGYLFNYEFKMLNGIAESSIMSDGGTLANTVLLSHRLFKIYCYTMHDSGPYSKEEALKRSNQYTRFMLNTIFICSVFDSILYNAYEVLREKYEFDFNNIELKYASHYYDGDRTSIRLCAKDLSIHDNNVNEIYMGISIPDWHDFDDSEITTMDEIINQNANANICINCWYPVWKRSYDTVHRGSLNDFLNNSKSIMLDLLLRARSYRKEEIMKGGH